LLRDAGVQGGLVVHLGCGDGKLTVPLRASDSYIVHGLDQDPANVARARAQVSRLGLAGCVSLDTFDGRRLPYVDNLVNLLVAEEPGDVPMTEVMRVLAPRGVAMVGGRRTVKPWPKDIDEWTHFLHGPDNNALAQDRVVGPPRHMQWLAGPKWTRHHHPDKGTDPTVRAVVSSGGRLFYMIDEAGTSDMRVPGRWFLAARDGFSGVLLWKKPLQVTRFERRLERVWRTLIADDGRVYAPLGLGEPLSALDAATGSALRRYAGTEGLQEAIKDGSTLLVVDAQGALLALHAGSGNLLWQWKPGRDGPIVPLTLAAERNVFLKTEQSVLCLSATNGKMVWRVPLPGPKKKVRLRYPRERLIVQDDIVLCSYGGDNPKDLDRDKYEYLGSHPRVRDYNGKLAALSAKDGRILWRGAYLPGLESMPGEIYVSDGLVWLGPDFGQPRDLKTGKVRETRPVLERLWTDGHHYRCYPGKATSRFIITAKRGVEMFDLVGESHSRNNWVRGTCRVGVTPCNGLLYAPPHSCGCYMEAKLYGFWALAAQRHGGLTAGEDPVRLEKGPAYVAVGASPSEGPPAGWWTYRGDSARSGSTASPVPLDLKPQWRADIGGRLSAVTAVRDTVFVAQIDARTVHALGAQSGKGLWTFAAGGRVDSPPTLYRGLALFGSGEGRVYCLRASDGRMAWRFLAAPRVRNAVAFEQVESLWPVHGSVLIHDGVAYVAAGRSSYLDGGIVLYGLEPETGKVRCTARVASEHTGALDPPSDEERSRMHARISQNTTDYKTFLAADRSDAFCMRGALTDVLLAERGSIFMRHLRFDGRLAQQDGRRPHLFSTSSLLDGEEHHRSHWMFGTGDFSRIPVAYPWIVTKKLAVPYGLMLAFDAETVWGVRRVGKREQTDHYEVFAAARPDPSDAEGLLPDFAARTGGSARKGGLWSTTLPMRPRAMVRAGTTLFIGGEAANGRTKGASLRMIACKDGKTLGEMSLDSAPVWDGMAAANGCLFIALKNGTVQCWR
jgi:outer membrane protein assembly factor BamB